VSSARGTRLCETHGVAEAPAFVVLTRLARINDEPGGKRRFPHFGINLTVLEPGERIGMYHRENAQEAFLVLSGECTLIVEGQERRLCEWLRERD
jgi:quercetin dioxygenase-like cupin family protein